MASKKTTVTVTCRPRQDFKGFGAIGKYFEIGKSEVIEASDEQLKELKSEPASFFLAVEKGDTTQPAQE